MTITLTKRADQIVRLAKEAARDYGQGYVGTEHLLLAIVLEKDGLGAQILNKLGATEERIREEIDRQLKERLQQTWVMGRLPGTPHFRDVLSKAAHEARGRGNWQICSLHLLLALLNEKESVGHKVLTSLGVTMEVIRKGFSSPSPQPSPTAPLAGTARISSLAGAVAD